jgi:hypothetical protein
VRITLIATGFDNGDGFFDAAVHRVSREPRPMRDAAQTYRPTVSAPPVSPPPPRASSQGMSPAPAPAPAFPEDDWVTESSIIKFLRER